jgi:choline dehydrogenase-like flavoprotein
MDTEKRELWDRLENEPERAYRAFECFLGLPSGERTLLRAYRQHVGNPDAAKPSDTWSGWSSSFAWRERAAAYDDHLASVRREAYERAVEEEAERQAREVELARGRYNELMTLAYVQAAEWLENAQPADLRAQDVIQIIRLYMDAEKFFGAQESSAEAEWTEEDEADVEWIVKEVDALPDLEHPEEKEGSEEGSGEDQSEESEDEET